MEQFIQDWGYAGVVIAIIDTGVGLPVPEEIPIVLAGGMCSSSDKLSIWIMLPLCIISVLIGDCTLYFIGRFWGAKLVQIKFIRERLLTPERFASIADNFHRYGVKILLFARLTPGIRAPIFIVAGMTELPLGKFLLADAIYAVPGVALLYFLGYFCADSVMELIDQSAYIKPIIVVVVVAAAVIYGVYKFWRKPVVTGSPEEMPPIVGPVTQTIEDSVREGVIKISQRIGLTTVGKAPTPPVTQIANGAADQQPPPSTDGKQA